MSIRVATTRKPQISFNFDDTINCTLILEKTNLEQFNDIKEGKLYDIEIKEHKNKRSLSQNAYLWKLINLLADKLNIARTTMYQAYVKEFGKYQIVAINRNAYAEFERVWCASGLGNQCQIIEEKSTDKSFVVMCFYGSSQYDTQEMSKLVDAVIQDCEAEGIPTLTKEEIMRLENENDRR